MSLLEECKSTCIRKQKMQNTCACWGVLWLLLSTFTLCTNNTPIITMSIYGGPYHMPGPVLIIAVTPQGWSTGSILRMGELRLRGVK